MHRYLTKVEEVGEVGTYQVQDPLLVVCLASLCLRLPISPQFDRDLPDMCGNEQPLYPLEDGVPPGYVAGKQMVAVTEEVSVGQRRVGSRNSQGRIVVAYISGQRDAKTVNYCPKTHLLSSVDYGAAETDTHLR